MSRFFISDTHFGHAGILTFLRNDGTKLRDFASLEDMHEHIVLCWNDKVTPGDTVYHLGDVALHHKHLPILERLNGRKILIRGNHDTAKLSQYAKYFADVRGYDVKKGYIASHIPIHEGSLARFELNIHGHLHANVIDDPRYFSVCCEQVDYTPISFEEIQEIIKNK